MVMFTSPFHKEALIRDHRRGDSYATDQRTPNSKRQCDGLNYFESKNGYLPTSMEYWQTRLRHTDREDIRGTWTASDKEGY